MTGAEPDAVHGRVRPGWLGWLIAPLSALIDPVFGAACGIPLPGFLSHGRETRWNTARRRRRGLALVLSGIEGTSYATRWMAYGLLRTRWRGAVVLHRWGDGVPVLHVLPNLMSSRRHEACARELLRVIEAYRTEQPGRPIVLIAQSGGCWIIVRALEIAAGAAAADQRGPSQPTAAPPIVDAAVLLTPAISRRHDLSLAAANCRRMLVTRSFGDWLFLGLAVTLLGNSDRRHGPAGGWLGWPARLRPGVQELAWRPEWVRLGWLGNHTTAAAPWAVRDLLRLAGVTWQMTSDE